MAIWTDIPDVNLEPDKPILSTDIIALRENPKAIAEKAAGAPVLANSYVVNAMIEDGAVTAAKIGANAVTTAKFNTGVRSFSGSLVGGESTTVTMSDQYAFLPRITTGTTIEAYILGVNSLRISNLGGANQSYAITWRYVA